MNLEKKIAIHVLKIALRAEGKASLWGMYQPLEPSFDIEHILSLIHI